MSYHRLSTLVAACLWIFLPRSVLAVDCNANGIEDSVDLGELFAGTKGGGGPLATGGAKVFRYTGGSSWEDISPDNDPWDLSAVMCMVFFDGDLYIGGQILHGYANLDINTLVLNTGQVWRWDGGRTWTQIGGTFTGSVTVLLKYREAQSGRG